MVKGPVVQMKFWDHSLGDNQCKPLRCEVFGVLYKESERAYYVLSWMTDRSLDSNTEQYCILKSAVISIDQFDFKKRLFGKKGKRRG